VGALIGGRVSNRFGRRNGLISSTILCLTGGILMACSLNLTMLAVSRVIIGFSSGIASVIVPIYIGEISPPSLRGSLGSTNQFALVIGLFVATLLLIPFSNPDQWRSLFALSPVLSLLQLLLSPFLVESPRWLISKLEVEDLIKYHPMNHHHFEEEDNAKYGESNILKRGSSNDNVIIEDEEVDEEEGNEREEKFEKKKKKDPKLDPRNWSLANCKSPGLEQQLYDHDLNKDQIKKIERVKGLIGKLRGIKDPLNQQIELNHLISAIKVHKTSHDSAHSSSAFWQVCCSTPPLQILLLCCCLLHMSQQFSGIYLFASFFCDCFLIFCFFLIRNKCNFLLLYIHLQKHNIQPKSSHLSSSWCKCYRHSCCYPSN